MSKKNMMFQLQNGNKLIGEIIEPTESFLNIIQTQMNLTLIELQNMVKDGIWIKRDQHFTYLENDLIKASRVATILDKES
ncbi:MAG: hypothetical protein JWM44_3279 [Bacilli bacterium]|nr:hypothetical protein [Bacilli bacterium]